MLVLDGMMRQGSLSGELEMADWASFPNLAAQLRSIKGNLPSPGSTLYLFGTTYTEGLQHRHRCIQVVQVTSEMNNPQLPSHLYQWNSLAANGRPQLVSLQELGLEWRYIMPRVKGLCRASNKRCITFSRPHHATAAKRRCFTLPFVPPVDPSLAVVCILPSGQSINGEFARRYVNRWHGVYCWNNRNKFQYSHVMIEGSLDIVSLTTPPVSPSSALALKEPKAPNGKRPIVHNLESPVATIPGQQQSPRIIRQNHRLVEEEPLDEEEYIEDQDDPDNAADEPAMDADEPAMDAHESVTPRIDNRAGKLVQYCSYQNLRGESIVRKGEAGPDDDDSFSAQFPSLLDIRQGTVPAGSIPVIALSTSNDGGGKSGISTFPRNSKAASQPIDDTDAGGCQQEDSTKEPPQINDDDDFPPFLDNDDVVVDEEPPIVDDNDAQEGKGTARNTEPPEEISNGDEPSKSDEVSEGDETSNGDKTSKGDDASQGNETSEGDEVSKDDEVGENNKEVARGGKERISKRKADVLGNITNTPKKRGGKNRPNRKRRCLQALKAKRTATRKATDFGARPVHRKDVKASGIIIPDSGGSAFCIPDTLATIISAIAAEEGRDGIQLPDQFVKSSDLAKHFRDAMAHDREWVSLGNLQEHLSSIGFQAVKPPDFHCNDKAAILTRSQGMYLVLCKLQVQGDDEELLNQVEYRHAIAYLADRRLLIDTIPWQKPFQVEDADVAAMTTYDESKSKNQNKKARRMAASEIFQRLFDGAANEVLDWFEISRA